MNWIKRNRLEFVVILLIFLVAAFLRFYKLDQYMTFLGDEGRDMLVIKGILVNHHIPLLGPPTSVGDMYLGPLYYYMMAVPLAIFWLNPVAAAGMDAVIGVLTVGLVYYLGREWFGKIGAFGAALLYAVSPVTIIYSRSSWNPNPAPFFALLSFLGIYKAHQTGNFGWFILTGACLAFAVQMHYLALILLPTFGLLWLNELRKKPKFFKSGTVSAIAVFLLLMSPLVIFDFRHQFMNYKALTSLFSGHGGSVSFGLMDVLIRILPIYQSILIEKFIAGQIQIISWVLAVLVLIPLIWVLQKKLFKRQDLKWQFLALGIWLVVGLIGLTFYRSQIYDHYVGFMNPVPFLMIGSLAIFKNKFWKWGLISLIVILVILNLAKNPLQNSPNNQLAKTQLISKYVIAKSQEKPFNFALLSEHNYDAAYQFYLDQFGYKPKELPYETTDQLFVVCEDPVCKPVGHPKFEIAAFGWTKIESEEMVDGVRIFKLVHNPDQPK